MGKIKLNLTSGGIVEKPLICAFKANNFSYVVLDNEMNGSMGLPIILVCKLENNKLIKIADQNEWQIVKEYLKNIIAGSQVEFINIESVLSADDIYYTQLTLPVPSFDALKNAYKVVGEQPVTSTNEVNNSTEPINNTNNIEPTINNSVGTNDLNLGANVSSQPTITPEMVNNNNVNVANPVVEGQTPLENIVPPQNPIENKVNVNEAAPVIEMPTPPINNNETTINPTPISPVIPEMPPVNNVGENVTPNPGVVSEPTPVTVGADMFKDQKEAFLQACENMFDALVQKFEKELQNRK